MDNPFAGMNGSDVRLEKELQFNLAGILGPTITIAAVATFAVLILSTSIDIMYVTTPGLRSMIDRAREKLKRTKHASSFGIISRTCVAACDEAERIGKSTVVVYLKKRVVYMCVAVTMLVILILGADTIVKVIANIISKIF